MVNQEAYDPTDTANSTAYTNVLLFHIPMAVSGGTSNAFPAGVSVSGYVLANAPQGTDGRDQDAVYRYNFAGYTAS